MKAREAAFRVIHEVLYKEGYSNIALEQILAKGDYDTRDAGFITELVLGTLRSKLYLEFIISNYSNIKVKKISPSAMSALLMGAYQILFMDRTPDSAACNESVKIASKFAGSRVRGFVNAILRAISREKDKTPELVNALKGNKYLSVRYSCSTDAVGLLVKQYGETKAQEILRELNEPARTCIRFNRIGNEKAGELLKERGIEYSEGNLASGAFYPDIRSSSASLDLFEKGIISIQDEGAQFMGDFTAPEPGDKVLDACASPGGKTIHMASVMQDTGFLTACDIHQHRVDNMKENFRRTGFTNIRCFKKDMSARHDDFIGSFNKVLIDAPCSGLGTARRRPEIKLSYKNDEKLTDLQYDILNSCADYVKSDGLLVYGTCTLFHDENRGIVDRFLDVRKDFELTEEKMILPHDDIGGFYMAKLVKI